ncbi:MAG TPA: bifunctional diguanylate cyclase/phosphodiesterase [Epsilonproteobacteria bacterium]|nr:bifunctional diguanylate cyclase/phosphodiesterase [Campylobacterota bacterium]
MNEEKFYDFLQKQILLLVGWSVITGFGFTILCFVYDVVKPAIVWYSLVIIISLWGWSLYQQFKYNNVDIKQLERWYLHVKLFIYVIFGLWTVLFILYSSVTHNNLNLVTIFTQIGASVIAATFLFSDKKLFVPILLILMYPLVIYFMSVQEAYGYFSAIYAVIFLGLLLYSSNNSNQLIQQIYYQAQHDSLTGLFNRRYFTDYLEQMLSSFKDSHKFAYLLLIDLDHFKTINDSLGHDVGDSLLKEVSNRITSYCEKTHLISRIGGDEFMIVSYEFDEIDACKKEAESFAKVLGEILKETYVIDYNHLHISASIGIKFIDRATVKTSQVIKDVDIAMYEAKADGRDAIVNFNNVLALQVDNTLEIERKLYFALKHNEIELHYQAQVDEKEKIIGCEVLSRWYNEELGLVSPVDFVSIAEKTGIIIELGNYILEESFKTLQKWENEGIVLEQFSINISVRQLMHESFLNHVTHLCNRYLTDTTRRKIIFEITETLLAEDIDKVVTHIHNLKKLDIRFSMDDFGTGYSSLSYLRELPINELKIDRAFVSRLGESDSDEMMIKTIFSLAKIFNLNVVAEGVETGEQFRLLLEHECHIFQGFYFSKPMIQEDFEIYLFRNKIKKVNTALKSKKEMNRKMII